MPDVVGTRRGMRPGAAFAKTAHGLLESVSGAGIDIELAPAGGLPDRNVDVDARALVTGIGQGGQAARSGAAECRKGVDAGSGDVRRDLLYGGYTPVSGHGSRPRVCPMSPGCPNLIL